MPVGATTQKTSPSMYMKATGAGEATGAGTTIGGTDPGEATGDGIHTGAILTGADMLITDHHTGEAGIALITMEEAIMADIMVTGTDIVITTDITDTTEEEEV